MYYVGEKRNSTKGSGGLENGPHEVRIFETPPCPKKKNFRPCHHQNHPNSGVFCIHLINGPKNGLTYTQNDREKWRNTFTMIVSASLHVLVTEKVQQAGTITLAPRCSHASDSPGHSPGNSPIPLFLGGVYPPIRRAQCDRRGASLGKRRSPVPRGAALCRCPGGKPPCNFGRLVGPYCP